MSVQIVVGAQWGDEGKGKIVDLLSEKVDAVARYQGGANAGHTVVIDGKKYIFHLIPSGILHPDVLCVIGNGVVFDPEAFEKELAVLEKFGISYSERILISGQAHVIMPYHKWMDAAREEMVDFHIGTTGRGIGPAYVDKYDRLGIRVLDLFSTEVLKRKLELNAQVKQPFLQKQEWNLGEMLEKYRAIGEQLRPFVADTSRAMNDLIGQGKNLLLEGAQGALLDVDFGTYPFVTSSNPISGGACTGLGIGPTKIDSVLGVTKAYTTRVGDGPFPTEFRDQMAEKIRQLGGEFGATTGRPRRCGWLDLVALRYAVRINGMDSLAITKLDVLDSLDTIQVAVAYQCGNKRVEDFPLSQEELSRCEPIYVELEGWKKETTGCKRYADLPQKAKEYLNFIAQNAGARVTLVSVGAGREETIWAEDEIR
jgi:adenylosuccinate synthase